MHGPTQHNERTSLLREGGDDGRRDIGPYPRDPQPSQLLPWAIPPEREPEDLVPDVTCSDIFLALLALLILTSLACGTLFILWLAATGLFHAISHIHWPQISWPHRSLQPDPPPSLQPEPPYVRKIAIIGINKPSLIHCFREFIF